MNILYPIPAGLNGVNPIIRSLDARSEDLNTIIQPGFINSIKSMGNELDITDLLLIAYEGGTQLFQQSISDGVITLAVYSPGDNSFHFTNIQFVAKGGSDLNVGNTIGSPKLTIPAALAAVVPQGVVVVLDSGRYEEPFVMPANVGVYAPYAVGALSAASGSLVTLNDTGLGYVSFLIFGAIEVNGGANAITVNGTLSGLVANILLYAGGPATVNGTLSLDSQIVGGSVITVGATGQLIVDVGFSGTSSIVETTPGSVKGKFGDTFYGSQTFLDKFVSHLTPSNETVGRTLTADDAGDFIAYNNVSNDNYTLPSTADAAIAVGTIIPFFQLGAGKIIFLPGPGVTVQSKVGTAVRTTVAFSKAEANKLSDTLWVVSGDIEIAP